MKMVLGRTYTLATTKGHRIHFTKDEAVNVPEICVSDAIAIGARAADGKDIDVIGEEKKSNDGPQDQQLREKEIIAAIELLVERNARKDFTAAGLPAIDALARVLGYEITASERARIWQIMNDRKAEAEA